MSYVIIKTVVKDGEDYWDVQFEDGHTISAAKADYLDSFQLVDEHCMQEGQSLPTEWRYE